MTDSTDDVFSALAHPTRRRILQDLASGEQAAGEIAARFSASGPTVSRHLAVLRSAGLVTERRDANRIIYSLVDDRIADVVGGFLAGVVRAPAAPAPTPARSPARKNAKTPKKPKKK